MNVLHVIQSLDPAAGGPPVMAARLAAAQSAQGVATQIASYRVPGDDSHVAASMNTIPGIAAVRLEYLPSPNRLEHILARGARRRIAAMLEGADLLHLHGVWDPILHAAAVQAFRCKKPYVLTPHGMLDTWSLQQKKLKKQIALVMGYRRMLNRAAFLHFLNSEERDLAMKLRLTAPSRILPNGIFLQELDPLPPRGTFRAARPQLAQGKMVLFLSRLHYKKGLDFLADAFAVVAREFPDAHLVVAGPDDGAKAPFEERIARLDFARRVHIIGPIYGNEKFAALRDCDCFCLPSRQEGFSMAVTEAMACEAPVVISVQCHFPEVSEAGAGVVVELTAQAIAAGMQTVLRDPAKAAQMGQAGRNLVTSRFTWPSVAQRMIENYQQVLSGPAS